MTGHTTTSGTAAGRRGITRRVRAFKERLSGQAQAVGDAHAQTMGWTITATSGRLGMSGRLYRDPRFAAGTVAAHSGPVPRRSAA